MDGSRGFHLFVYERAAKKPSAIRPNRRRLVEHRVEGPQMFRWLLRLFVLGLLPLASAADAQTLASIKASRHFDCGTVQSADDWNGQDVHGDLSALGGEICRAVAVAILGDAEGLSIHAYPAEPEALAALKAGEVQLAVGVSPSATAAVQFEAGFGPPVFYDSQRILVAKDSGIVDLAGLRDQVICALDMSAPERTLRDELTVRNISYALQAHSEQGELDAAVAVRRCVGTGMESRLAQSRANFHARTSDFVFLPERLALAPVVPAYSDKDPAFGRIVDWTINALIEAEALGITKDNVVESGKREDMRADQLLGHDFATANALGLTHDWAVKVIAATGNYGEIFERTTGKPYQLERGINALWTQGGLMAPMPMK
jgi:general L-amino acid transport system substrate-binding protein